jgi:hypothetical protein
VTGSLAAVFTKQRAVSPTANPRRLPTLTGVLAVTGRRRLILLSFATLVAFLVIYRIADRQGVRPFYYDAGGYWSYADSFVDPTGDFSLMHFNSDLRGYALPLILHELKSFNYHVLSLNDWQLVNLFNAAIFALIGMVLAPALAQVVFPQQRWGLIRRAVLTALLVAFWSGYLLFPLSDFPALATALLALLLASRMPSLWATGLSGAMVALAIEMRPAYLMLAPVLVVIFALQWRRARRAGTGPGSRRWAAALALMAAGFVLVVLPQSLAAHKHFNTWSFLPGASLHLGPYQLTEGTRMQRYETIVDPAHFGGLVYGYGPGGNIVIEQEGQQFTGGLDYAGAVATHPHTFASVYVRHLFNGFDQRYNTPYPVHQAVGSMGLPLRVLGLAITFLALVRLAWPAARRRLGPARWSFAIALAATTLTTIPSAMETRFMLPLWILAFILVLGGSWPNPLASGTAWRARLRVPAAIAVSAVVFGALAWAIASNTSAHLKLPPPYPAPPAAAG